MPSRMRRRTPAGTWVDVADFDYQASGAKWYTGTGVPSDPATNSFYLEMTTKDIYYRADTVGSWTKVGNISDWDSAWGLMARGTLWNQGGSQIIPASGQPNSSQDLASLTFTPTAGRRYMFTMFVRAIAPNDGVGWAMGWGQILRAGVSLAGDPWHRTEDNYGSLLHSFIYTSTTMGTTSATFAYRFNNSGEAIRVWMDAASYFTVEDMGPARGDTT